MRRTSMPSLGRGARTCLGLDNESKTQGRRQMRPARLSPKVKGDDRADGRAASASKRLTSIILHISWHWGCRPGKPGFQAGTVVGAVR